MTSSCGNTFKKNSHKDTFFNIRLDLLVCLFLALSILAVYWQVRTHDFVNFDDNVYVTDNPHVKAGLTLESIAWSFRGVHHGNWHPLTWISHMIDVSLYGMNPGQHHLTSVLFHIINTLLLFLVFRRMTNDLWKSGFVAALFALHPLHVESVAWVSERKDVLCAFFWLLSMWSYFWYTEKPCVARYMLILLFLIMGIMSKPMIVTFPFVLLLLDYWPLGRLSFSDPKSHIAAFRKSDLRLLFEKIPLFVFVAISCVLTFLAEKSGGSVRDLGSLPFEDRVANALVSYVLYMEKTFWPQEICVLYPHPMSWPLWQTVLAALLLIFISLGALLSMRKLPYFAVGWLWYLGTLVPVIGLVQVGNQSMADRYTYMPAIGIFIIIGWGVPSLFAKLHCGKWIPATASIALLSILMTTTWMQIRYWNSSITLFEHTLNVTNNNPIMHYGMGVSLSQSGKSKEAMVHYKKAIDIDAACYKAHNNLGFELASQGKDTEAISHYREALRINPTYGNAHNNLGNALIRLGKLDEAIEHYRKALRANPRSAGTHKSLGLAMLRTGEIEPAIFHLETSLQLEPANQITQSSLILAKFSYKQIKAAVERFRKSLQFFTKNPDLAHTLDMLTKRKIEMLQVFDRYEKALSLQPYFHRNQLKVNNLPQFRSAAKEYDRALGLFETATALQPGNPTAFYHAACVYARKNKIKKSIAMLETASRMGFTDREILKIDRDLENIKNYMGYNNLLKIFPTSTQNPKLDSADGSSVN